MVECHKEVKKVDGLLLDVQKNIDCLLGASRTLVKDVCVFNVEYKETLQKKNKGDETLFKVFENSMTTFHKKMSKVVATSETLISEALLNKVISSIEGCFNILEVVFILPIIAPHVMQVSQAAEKGGSSKLGGEDKGKMFGKFKLANNFHEDEHFKFMEMRFHAVLVQKEEQLWCLKRLSS
ncbi:unnamed protein product [Lactuca saligna]|uniref:Uncharacterized protein n=1 Tax=Lactuca saligna TaxID=75948 RepID=A0AA35YYZ2_LACSI|nr:unnamed protein product [Lactuca saligna]